MNRTTILWSYADGRQGEKPTLAHDDDAGFDLSYCGLEPISITPNCTVDIPTGVCVQLPAFTWGLVTGRSSTFRKRNLITPLGVIDNGYRGELFAIVRNVGDDTVVINPGERVAQLIVMPMLSHTLEWQFCGRLDDTSRGTKGFGSSGF